MCQTSGTCTTKRAPPRGEDHKLHPRDQTHYSQKLIRHDTVVLVVPVVPVVQWVPWDQAGLLVQSGLVNPTFLDPPEPPEENRSVKPLSSLISEPLGQKTETIPFRT